MVLDQRLQKGGLCEEGPMYLSVIIALLDLGCSRRCAYAELESQTPGKSYMKTWQEGLIMGCRNAGIVTQ